MFNVRTMSAPLSRKNLPENPTPDDILNAFLDYLTATGTEPYDHQQQQITRDRNNQNILALLYLLGNSHPIGFSQVSMQDVDPIHLGMDVGETPTLLEVE